MSSLGIQVQGTVTVEQFLHRHGVIHPGAIAWENAGLGVDIQTVLAVQGFDIGVAKRLRGVFRHRLDDAPVGARELELMSSRGAHPVAALVHQAMVEVTQLHQIREARLTAMGPVRDVVALDEMPGGAPREAATPLRGQAHIPGPECPVNGRGDAAGLAAHVERHAGTVFRKTHDARVAGEPPGAFAGQLRKFR